MKTAIPIVLLALIAIGCQSLYDSAVTLTQVENIAMSEYSDLSKAGKTTPKMDATVRAAHTRFKQAATVTADALEAYKTSGDNGKYLAALRAARTAATEVIDLIVPLLTPAQGSKIQTDLTKAQKL